MIVQEQRCSDKRERRVVPLVYNESGALWRARRTVTPAAINAGNHESIRDGRNE
jgi:hypothetical protein